MARLYGGARKKRIVSHSRRRGQLAADIAELPWCVTGLLCCICGVLVGEAEHKSAFALMPWDGIAQYVIMQVVLLVDNPQSRRNS